MARRIEVELIGDSRSLERAFARSEKAAKGFGRTMERASRGSVVAAVGFHGLGRAVGYASASFLGAAGFTAAVKAGFDELFAGQKAAAQTAAAIKSTGGVAGVTARQINTLAGSLQKLTGYDDEAIQSAENLLLTFTNVRNVAGKNNDIFNQATEATLNLSRTFDQDLGASAVQLGKALQDPVRGVTSLRRIGVSFTQAQQNMINRLVKTGDVLGAQKIILQEVTRETGNAARAYGKTLPGQLDILQGNLQNLGGELAKTLNPEVKKLTDRFNKWLENPEHKKKVIDDFTASINALGAAARFAAATVGALSSTWNAIPDFFQGAIKASLLFGPNVLKALGVIGGGGTRPGQFVPGKPIYPGAPVYGPPRTRRPPGVQGPLAGGAARPGGVDTTPTGGLTANELAQRRNQWFDAMISRQLGRVQDITSLRGQIARLGQIADLVRARLAITKDITRRLTLEDQVRDILRTRRQTKQTLSDQLKQQAQDDAEAAKAARQAATESARGWLEFAIERADATKTLKDDLRAYRNYETWLKAIIKKEGLTLEYAQEIWRVRQKIKDLNKKNKDLDPLAGLVQVSSRRLAGILAAGTGLGVAGRGRLAQNVSGLEITSYVQIDGREVGRAVTKDQARTGRRTSRQTSGFRG